MGSAAARHIAGAGKSVALIGPDEPVDKANHAGVFASHYDQARIIRKLDSNADWAQFSIASIDRYDGVEQATSIPFFSPVGFVMAGPEHGPWSGPIQQAARIGAAPGIEHDILRGEQISQRFAYFDFPEGTVALHERDKAGWVNPRAHIAAHIALAETDGAVVHRAAVQTLDEYDGKVVATCQDGTKVSPAKAVVACSGFSPVNGLLPDPLPMTVLGRTVALFELDQDEAHRLRDMPSVIYYLHTSSNDVYILPPVMYPDGKTYIKIGGGGTCRS